MLNKELGMEIPKLGFGLMRLPMTGDEVDMEQTKNMVDKFLQEGFTYFDTAYVYINGKSEMAVKEAIVKRHPRENFQIATKMPVWMVNKYEDHQRLFEEQLERTGAGYFDYYLLHALNDDRLDELEKNGSWRFVQEMKEKGLIKHAGFSFHDSAECLEKILKSHPEAEFVQLQINYADWESSTVESRKCYEVARKYDIPVIVMEPIKGGSLAALTPDMQAIFKEVDPELSIASWAMRYVASLEGIITVLSGMSTLGQMEDNLSYMTDFTPMQEVEYAAISKVIEEINKIPIIPCTSCKYCVEGCPQKINIPGVFEGYNDFKMYQNFDSSRGHYHWVTSNSGKASDCIACGECESHCPQKIQIIDSLKEVAKVFE